MPWLMKTRSADARLAMNSVGCKPPKRCTKQATMRVRIAGTLEQLVPGLRVRLILLEQRNAGNALSVQHRLLLRLLLHRHLGNHH